MQLFGFSQFCIVILLTLIMPFTDGMKIDVKYGREYFDVEVNENDTVATLKQKIGKIKELGPIPAEKQILRWNSGGPVLNESNKKLEEYGIKKVDDIIVSWDEFQIFVQYERTKYPFVVKALDTVQKLKEKITQIIRILPEKQNLTFDRNGREKHAFVVKPEDTMPKLKEKITHTIGILPEDDPPAGGSILWNHQTIEYYGIVKDDIVLLSLRFQIRVITDWLDGSMSSFRVMGTDTVQSLKDRIRQKKGAEWNCKTLKIKLRKADKDRTELENEKTLDDYGILPGKELKFSTKL
ncbi:hypothetical protein niasHS_018100 [Heterodera schachtii]|uniref:Ubiquitin-like domain-containing protein n=2 Tax=Heterodera TaxID=34509 RepID=A0ABD2HX68_HETSC